MIQFMWLYSAPAPWLDWGTGECYGWRWWVSAGRLLVLMGRADV